MTLLLFMWFLHCVLRRFWQGRPSNQCDAATFVSIKLASWTSFRLSTTFATVTLPLCRYCSAEFVTSALPHAILVLAFFLHDTAFVRMVLALRLVADSSKVGHPINAMRHLSYGSSSCHIAMMMSTLLIGDVSLTSKWHQKVCQLLDCIIPGNVVWSNCCLYTHFIYYVLKNHVI